MRQGPSPAATDPALRPAQTGSRAFAALLVTAAFLAATTNLSKVSASAGVPPASYLAWSSLGAGLLLLAIATLRGGRARLNRRTLEYWLLAALFSVAGPNLIFFSTVETVGVGFVAIMIALPPLLTYAGALALGMERFAMLRALGVLLALSGAAVVAFPKLSGAAAPTAAALLTLLGPLLLAVGNLYRTARWPEGASPEALAPGMMIASSALVFGVGPALGLDLEAPVDGLVIALIGSQAVVFAAQYLAFFVLQKRGGPVYLSLLGAVSALFAVPIGVAALGEAPPQGLLPAALLIGAGVFLLARRPRSTRSQTPLSHTPERTDR